MQLFLEYQYKLEDEQLILCEETSKHLVQVLRMQNGDQFELTNGSGVHGIASIIDNHKKHCTVSISNSTFIEKRPYKLTIAVGFTKNKSRNEWMLEKMTELGVDCIIPLQCKRSEKDKINMDRLRGILEAATIQSKQYYVPEIKELTSLKNVIEDFDTYAKYIAHCEDEQEKQHFLKNLERSASTLIFIGPEGDFSQDEIKYCLENACTPISLGVNRLRTETAAVYATTIFNAINYE